MSDTTTAATDDGSQKPIWDRSFTNDLSNLWANIKPMATELVPPEHPWYQKITDVTEAPFKLAFNSVVGGATDFARIINNAMRDPNLLNDPAMQHAVTKNLIMSGAGLSTGMPEAEGLPSFPAWHGSRHIFGSEPAAPFGKFDEGKVGTGEGAQVRGWGHYIAGEKETAEHYRTAGSSDAGDPGVTLFDGQPMNTSKIYSSMPTHQAHAVSSFDRLFSQNTNATWEDARTELLDSSAYYRESSNDMAGYLRMASINRDLRGQPTQGIDLSDEADKLREQDLRSADELSRGADWLQDNHHRLSYIRHDQGGNLYQVWIKPEAHEMLDQDRIWDQQPQGVKDKISKNFPDLAEEASAFNLDGQDVYEKLAEHFQKNKSNIRPDQAASEALDKAGIPGMKFLDQGSRGLPKVIHLDDKPWEAESDPELLVKNIMRQGDTPLHQLGNWSLQDSLNTAWNHLSNDLDEGSYDHSRDLFGPTMSPEEHHQVTNEALDWIQDHQDNMKMGDHPDATHNYVMFHHRHINVIDRNGQVYGLNPVDHDPFER